MKRKEEGEEERDDEEEIEEGVEEKEEKAINSQSQRHNLPLSLTLTPSFPPYLLIKIAAMYKIVTYKIFIL